MRASSGLGMTAIAALLAAAPLDAQSGAPAPAPSPTPAPERGTVGPRELRDFSLPGTTPAPVEPQAEPERSRPTRERAPARSTTPPPVRERAPPPRAADPVLPAATQPVADPPQDLQSQPAGIVPLPSAETPYVSQPTPDPASLPPAAAPPASQDAWTMWPWLVAALLSGALAAYALHRRRSRLALANAANLEAFVPAEPPAPIPPQPKVSREAARPAASGLISARLRPSLELEFQPLRGVIEERQATIEFSIIVRNRGSAPAREVRVTVAMFNAGPSQDQEIARFFEKPATVGDRLQVIAPMSHLNITTRVSLPIDQVRPFEVAGRKLFVPMVAFNALYRWSGGEGQTSNSYLVGREGDGEKMAPLRLDLGPRVFRKLGARLHHLRVHR